MGPFALSVEIFGCFKCRYILLIKLSTGWDRKLILLRKRDLRNFRIKRLFLREDVAPGHKLRQRQSAPPPQDNTTALSYTVLLINRQQPM